MVDKLPSIKAQRIIKAKLQGQKHKDIAAIEYPEATEHSGVELVSRQLRKNAQYIEQSKLVALKEAGITWQWIVDGIKEAGEAYKQNNFTGEITPDHTTRLSARKQARELMESQHPEEASLPLNNLPKGIDEVQMIRLLKNAQQ